MKNELLKEIEQLYITFSKYSFNPQIKGCSCCLSNTDKFTLTSKPLRELEDDDINRFAYKTMTTWGTVDDFKYYLPRILELTAQNKLTVHTFIILGKLEYSNWKNWDKSEADVIHKFLITWWTYDINNRIRSLDFELFIELNKLLKNLPLLLEKWNVEVNEKGFVNYINLIEAYFEDIIQRKDEFEEFSNEEIKLLLNWINSNKKKLEVGYLKTKNEEIRESIKLVIDILKNR
ncbi:hypothetical protein [Flammeovirga agarivorans]|uniref:Uncharacterized protein n=1 Tax=Flammeovirga agarivorans TaxID=2726742 RepID=A0A7X8SRI1_9BACT|nr:hypothetical protein [Flammeovirga agarivorans]NLR95053.1 hypothetical protein [Flammeovirga agarivorans]